MRTDWGRQPFWLWASTFCADLEFQAQWLGLPIWEQKVVVVSVLNEGEMDLSAVVPDGWECVSAFPITENGTTKRFGIVTKRLLKPGRIAFIVEEKGQVRN